MNNQVEDIKRRVDLVGYISQSVVLKRKGRLYQGLCPFHGDKDPSFTVYPETHSYYCFGCAAAGDIFTWLEQMEGLDFKEALKRLGGEVKFDPPKEPKRKIPLRSGEIPIELIRHWHSNLNDRRAYFHGRGFTDATVDEQLFGWSGHRFVVPVWEGKPQESAVVQVRLRKAPGDESSAPKYLNLTGFPGPYLYNSWALEGQEAAVIFFGEFDAALAYQHGLPAASPTNGMLCWNEEWTRRFLRDKGSVKIVPDRGEEERGWRLRAEIDARATVVEYPDDFEGKDFTDWILSGRLAQDLFVL